MEAQQRNDQPRYDENVQREKSGQRFARDGGSSQHQVHHLRADEWNAAHNGCADAESPISILIEAQNLSRKRHAKGAQKKNTTTDPSQLARIFVSSEQKRLHQMQTHDGDHEDGAPVVNRAQEPAQELFVVQILKTGPSLARRGHIDESQEVPVRICRTKHKSVPLPNT